MAIAIAPLLGFAALAVDYGRVIIARSQLSSLTDAAARFAITGIVDGTALAKANSVGRENRVDGTTHSFERSDVDVGVWDPETRTFTPSRSAPTAVRVTGRRTGARGNAVALVLGSAVGMRPIDLVEESIAQFQVIGYGVVGLDYIRMSGNSSDSYWPAAGRPTGEWGSIASNGDITLSGSSHISGNASPGVGKTVYGANRVTGETKPLEAPLSFPNGDAGAAVTNNDNEKVPASYKAASSFKVGSNATLSLPGGEYYFNNINISGDLSFRGPTTVYCYGDFTLSGHAQTNAGLPKNLKIVMCPSPSGDPPGSVMISSSAALYASIYAPQSPVTLGGSGDVYGSVLGRSVTMSGTSAIHYDLSLEARNGKVEMVK